MNTAANIAHTLQDCYKRPINTKIEQLCQLILESKGTDFFEKCQKVWHLSIVSPSTFVMEVDCILAENPF